MRKYFWLGGLDVTYRHGSKLKKHIKRKKKKTVVLLLTKFGQLF